MRAVRIRLWEIRIRTHEHEDSTVALSPFQTPTANSRLSHLGRLSQTRPGQQLREVRFNLSKSPPVGDRLCYLAF
jgi:hypothetical protein